MKLVELMQGIQSKSIPSYLIFTGEEVAVMKIYENMICEGFQRVDCNSVEYAINDSRKRSLTNQKKCYIILDDMDFIKNEKAWELAKNHFKNTKHQLILKYSKYDKRKSFFKQENVVMFDKLSDDVLTKYIQKEIALSDENCIRLIQLCENDYSRILLEVDKIKSYCKSMNLSENKSFYALINQNVIYQPIGDITFKLTDAVADGNIEKAMKYLDLAKQKDEPAIMVLSILYTEFKALFMVKGLGSDKKDASKRTGLNGWQVSKAMKRLNAYNMQEIKRALKVITETEQGIKSGKIDQEIALEYAIINIMKECK